MMSAEDYFKLYYALKSLMHTKFDIVDLKALQEDDIRMDQMLLDMGLSINENSAYKTIKKETIWMTI